MLTTQEAPMQLTEISKYWEKQALSNIDWHNKWHQTLQGDFTNLNIKWFVGGKLNVCYNCVDRHLETNPDKTAIIWEGNDITESKKISYLELHTEICKFANVLKKYNINKGDRICIYMPMIPEAIIAMLAAARIGAIHSVVFAGFSADALKSRIIDAECKLIITADASKRGTKIINLKENVDLAIKDCPSIKHVVVVKHAANARELNYELDIDYHAEMAAAPKECQPEPMLATDPLFILYTSGSTGSPKGVLHNCGGYIVYVATTFKQIFADGDNLQKFNQDVFWCTADIGWITGHSYLVYGPLANGTTSVLYEGIPSHPNFARYWEIIDKYQVTQFYTSPTALRALRKEGDAYLQTTTRSSLKLLGVVGEPLNPEIWDWFYTIVGKQRCPIVNTWWQTETGGIMLSPPPINNNTAKGSVGKPIIGVNLDIVDDDGFSITNNYQVGNLVVKNPWPGLMHTIFGNHQRFIDNYFSTLKNCYYTGDGAYRDAAGNFWISGRVDDVMNVSGHRIGTEELESAFLSHPSVAEAAVVGAQHPIKGESVYAFITLKTNIKPSTSLHQELIQLIRAKVGAFATPDTIHWTRGLPKTRSGKIMRRILRKIANNDLENLGDTSTLADPNVINQIIENRI